MTPEMNCIKLHAASGFKHGYRSAGVRHVCGHYKQIIHLVGVSVQLIFPAQSSDGAVGNGFHRQFPHHHSLSLRRHRRQRLQPHSL